jgi:deazaflavin-dependent oxidoreductase (nitroreductase family)
MEKIRDVKPPRGIEKALFKLPNFFYNMGLGSIMGSRFVQLAHIGRNSGRIYKTVVEVVDYDPDRRKIYIASGFRQRSDWYKNILKTPQIEINFRGKLYEAVAMELDKREAEQVLLNYAHQHPLAMKELARFMGYEIDGSDGDVRRLADELPLIEVLLK